jgi:uncharacterized membrane protein HdeD (DUF308 family)
MTRRLTRTPWALAARGTAALVFGLLTLLRPSMTVAGFVGLFAALAVVDGAAASAAALRFRRRGRDAAAVADPAFLLGAAAAALGPAVLLWPDLTMRLLLTAIALWAVLTAAGHLHALAQPGGRAPGWALLAGAGVSALALAAVVAIALATGEVRVGWEVGAYGIASGVLLLASAWRSYVTLAAEPRPSWDRRAGGLRRHQRGRGRGVSR